MALLLLTVTLGCCHRLDQAEEERLVSLMRAAPGQLRVSQRAPCPLCGSAVATEGHTQQ